MDSTAEQYADRWLCNLVGTTSMPDTRREMSGTIRYHSGTAKTGNIVIVDVVHGFGTPDFLGATLKG